MRPLLLSLSLLASSLALAGSSGGPSLPFARPLWTVTVDQGSSIATAGYFGLFAVQKGRAVALDHLTGRIKWRSAANDVTGTPLEKQPLVLFSKHSGGVRALDFFTGQERWVASGKSQIQLSRGPTLRKSQTTVFSSDPQTVRVLDERTGHVLWQVNAVSPEHTPFPATFSGDMVLLLHSPSEGFLGNVYTAHDPATGRELWRLKAGHGYLLGETHSSLVFDLRDWHNLLGAGGTIKALRIDPHTGQRSPLTLKVGMPNASEWKTEPGTLKLDGEGGTWAAVVRAKGGATRLIHTPARGKARFWTLPAQHQPGSGGFSLRLVSNGVLLGSPDGSVTRFERGGPSRSILAVGGGAPFISERLGGVRVTVRVDQTAFLDENEHVRLRVPGRADAWTAGGDLQTVMVLEGTRLSGYAWPGFCPAPSCPGQAVQRPERR